MIHLPDCGLNQRIDFLPSDSLLQGFSFRCNFQGTLCFDFLCQGRRDLIAEDQAGLRGLAVDVRVAAHGVHHITSPSHRVNVRGAASCHDDFILQLDDPLLTEAELHKDIIVEIKRSDGNIPRSYLALPSG